MSNRDWEKLIGRLVIYRKGRRWTVLWRSGKFPNYRFRTLIGGEYYRD